MNNLGGGGRRGWWGQGFDGISKGGTASLRRLRGLFLLPPWRLEDAGGPAPRVVWGTGFLVPQEDGTPSAFLGTRVPLTQEVRLQPITADRRQRGEHRQTVRSSGISEQKVVSLAGAV